MLWVCIQHMPGVEYRTELLDWLGGGGQVVKHSGAPWAIWQASQASKMKQKEVSDTIYGRRWKAPATHYTILVRAFLSQSKTECSPDF